MDDQAPHSTPPERLPEPVDRLPEPAGRRGFLERFMVGSGLVLCGAYAGGALVYLAPAKDQSSEDASQVDAGPEADLPVGQAKVVSAGSETILVIHADDGWHAVAAACTHLGCIVEWDAERKQIHCPCHAANFDLNGNVLGGPAPKPLPVYAATVQEGQIIVSKG